MQPEYSNVWEISIPLWSIDPRCGTRLSQGKARDFKREKMFQLRQIRWPELSIRSAATDRQAVWLSGCSASRKFSRALSRIL